MRPATSPRPSSGPIPAHPSHRGLGATHLAGLWLGAIVGTTALANAQHLVLPYYSTFTESQRQEGSSGTAVFWKPTASRFQILYDATNFLEAGVTGPITITHLRFRAEDGESNLGGQLFQSVEVQLRGTSIPAALMSPTWSVNYANSTPPTLVTTNVVVAPASGTVPNDYVIDIDLAALGAMFPFDPTGAFPNLFVEITVPTAPLGAAPLALVPMQQATPYHSAGVYQTTSTTGHLSSKPPVMAIEFLGTGGQPVLIPATNEYLGAACGGFPSAFYERFCTGNQFDLGSGLTLVPNVYPSPSTYTVVGGAPPVDRTQVNAFANSTADDATVQHNLGFTFSHPGGSDTVVSPDTNGNVKLGVFPYADASPSIDEFLGFGVTTTYGPRFALFWHDLHAGRNLATHPNSGLHVRTDTSGGPGNAVCYATWLDVGPYDTVTGAGVGGHGVFTMQCAIHEATGIVEFRYGQMSPVGGSNASSDISALVGFSRGNIGGFGGTRSVDPQTRDLSHEVPFSTEVEGSTANLRLRAINPGYFVGPNYGGRMVIGRPIAWTIDQIPANSQIGALAIDFSVLSPGAFLPGVTAPGCIVSLLANPQVWQVFPLAGVTSVTSNAMNVAPDWIGTVIYSQFVVVDGLFGAPDLITVSSNVLKQTVGLP